MHYEVAAVISVLGLAVVGRPLLAGGQTADAALTLPASAALVAAAAAPPAPAPPAAPAPAPAEARPRHPAPADPLAWFAPGGRNQGTENLAAALAAIALQGNEPLYVSDGWGRTWGSSTSDHFVGQTNSWATDLAVRGIQRPTPQTEEAARRVAAALGRSGLDRRRSQGDDPGLPVPGPVEGVGPLQPRPRRRAEGLRPPLPPRPAIPGYPAEPPTLLSP